MNIPIKRVTRPVKTPTALASLLKSRSFQRNLIGSPDILGPLFKSSVASFALLASLSSVQAASSTWTALNSDANWYTSTSWMGGIQAGGASATAATDTAYFTLNADGGGNLSIYDSGSGGTYWSVIGNMVFGDTDTTSGAGFVLAPSRFDTFTTLCLGNATTPTAPTITVNSLAAGKVTTIQQPLSGVRGLTKAGAGTLVLGSTSIVGAAQVSSFTGGVNLKGGLLTLDMSGMQTAPTDMINSANALTLGGGSLTVTGRAATSAVTAKSWTASSINSYVYTLTFASAPGVVVGQDVTGTNFGPGNGDRAFVLAVSGNTVTIRTTGAIASTGTNFAANANSGGVAVASTSWTSATLVGAYYTLTFASAPGVGLSQPVTGTGLTNAYVANVNNNQVTVYSTSAPAITGSDFAAASYNPVTSQSFAGTTVAAGGGQVLINPNNATGTTTVNVGALTTTAAGGSLLAGKAAGASGAAVITTTTGADAAGIYGGRVVYTTDGGTTVDWAATASSSAPYTLGSYSGYTTLPTNGLGSTTNYKMTSGTTLAANGTVNTLKLENAAGALNLGANTLTINSGGLLISGAVPATISNGTLTSGSSNGAYDLVVQQYNTGGLNISAVIADNGVNATSLTKAGPGTLTLTGVNTFTGATYVNGGVLAIQNASALGSTSGISVFTGGALQISNGITVAKALTLQGDGIAAAGALRSTSGANTYSGAITLGSPARISADYGSTLALTSATNITGTGYNLTVSGAGNTTINSAIATGDAASLIKYDGGNLTLNSSSANTFAGGLFINGGTVVLDFANLSGASNLVKSGNPLGIDSGVLSIKGNATAATTTQTLGDVKKAAGSGRILIDPVNASGTTTLALGNLSTNVSDSYNHPTGGTLLLGKAAGASGVAVITSTNGTLTNGIYGGRVVYTTDGGTTVDWATTASGSSPYTLGGYSSYTALPTSGLVSTTNYSTAGTTLAASGAANTLKLLDSGALNLGGFTLTLTTGGLLASGSTAATVSNGTLTAGNASGSYELIVHQYNTGGLTVSGTIANNGGNATILTKSGPGTLTLTSANSYTGATYVNEGAVNIQNATALGTTAGGVIVAPNAALQMQGGITVGSEALTLFGLGVSNDGALRNISGANTYQGAITLGSYARINSDTGTLTLSGAVANTGYGLTVGGAGNVTVSNVISGAGALTKDGAGTLTLSNANTYTGGTLINSGTLNFSNASALGSGLATFAGNATLQAGAAVTIANNVVVNSGVSGVFDTNGNAVTFSGAISGAGALTKNGTGTLTLSGTNTYDGATTVNAGNLKITNASALGSSVGSTTVANGAHLQLATTGSNTIAENFTLASSSKGLENVSGTNTLTGLITLGVNDSRLFPTGGTLTIAGGITASTTGWGLTFQGSSGGVAVVSSSIDSTIGSILSYMPSAQLFLTGSNAFTGLLTIQTGIVNIQNSSALGSTSGGVNVQSTGALQIQGGITVGAEAINLNGSGYNSDGTGALRNISDNNIYGGLVTLTGTTRINSDAGTLTLSNVGTITGSGYGLSVGGAGNTVISSAIGTGTGTLTKDGSGTVTLTGTNTYTGATTISAGTLQLGNSGTTGALSTSSAIVNNGNLTINRSNAVAQGTDFSGEAITGTGSFTQAGTGTTTLTAANTYTGTTTISAGTLQLGNSGTTGALSTSSAIVNNGNLTINRSNAVVQGTDFSGEAITGTGSFTQAGTGTTTLTAANTYTGATTISAGTLQIDGSTAAGSTLAIGTAGTLSGVGTVNGNATLTGNGIINKTSGTIAGTLGVTGGYWNGAGSVTGVVTASSGIFTIGSGANLTANGGLNITGGTLVAGNSTSTINGSVNYTSSSSSSFTGVIAGSGNTLTLNNASATLTLSGTNTYDGATTVNAGNLKITNASALGSSVGSTTVANGAHLQLATTGSNTIAENFNISGNGGKGLENVSGTNTLTGLITLGVNGTRLFPTGGTLTIAGGITASTTGWGLTFQGSSGGVAVVSSSIDSTIGSILSYMPSAQLFLTGSNAFTGLLTIQTGIVNIQNSSALGSTSGGVNVQSTGALQIQGGITVGAEAINLNGSGYNSDGTGALRNISDNNIYGGLVTLTGTTRINSDAGTLTLSNVGTITGSGYGLSVGGAGNTVISSAIGTGTGTLTKDGSGTVTLTGTNTYTGATLINGGKLAVNGSIDSAVTVATTGTLGGSGRVGGAVAVQSGGHFAPGNSIANTFSTGALTLAAGSFTDIELGTVNASPSLSVSDRTTVNGTLALGGILTLIDNNNALTTTGTNGGSAGAGSYLIFTGATGISGAFSGVSDITGYHAKVDSSSVAGNVYVDNYQIASTTSSIADVSLGKYHVGSAPTVTGTFTNNASSTFGESLSVTGSTAGAATVSLPGLIAGGASSTVTIGATAGAGVKNGTVVLGLYSDGAGTSGYGTTALSSQTVQVTGTAYNLAATSTATETVDVGITHRNQAFQNSATVNVSNTAPTDATYTECLKATLSVGSNATVSGAISNLAGGSTDTTSLQVGLNVDVSEVGSKTGSASIAFVSNDLTGTGDTSLGSKTVNITGQVNDYAQPVFENATIGTLSNSGNNFTLSLGTFDIKDGAQTLTISLSNTTLSNASFQDLLNGAFTTLSGGVNFDLSGLSITSDIAAGTSQALTIGFTPLAWGAYSGSIQFTGQSINTSGTETLSAPLTLSLEYQVVPEPATWSMIVGGFGMLVFGQRLRRRAKM